MKTLRRNLHVFSNVIVNILTILALCGFVWTSSLPFTITHAQERRFIIVKNLECTFLLVAWICALLYLLLLLITKRPDQIEFSARNVWWGRISIAYLLVVTLAIVLTVRDGAVGGPP